jgi:hypothetical protein
MMNRSWKVLEFQQILIVTVGVKIIYLFIYLLLVLLFIIICQGDARMITLHKDGEKIALN